MYPFEGRVLNILVKFFPSLETALEQTESGLTATQYLGGAIISSIIFFLLVTSMLFIMIKIGSPIILENTLNVIVIALVGVFFSFVVFLNSILYPNWKAQRLSAEYERDLIFAVRHLMIQTSAGIPLFDAIVSVGEERGGLGYGAISREFRRLAKEVKGGKDLTQVLNESASRSPSRYYSRVMWQLANASRTGVPINQILKGLVDYLSDEQRIALRNYGSELNPLALMYMLTTIIGPTLGVVFLMIISTFTAVPVNQTVFAVILTVIVAVQVMFLGLIKSRRPNVAI
jgi:pilus assembly protein TadC